MEDVTRRTDKVLNIHFYAPELIPMVDIMGGTKTSDRTMAVAEKWAREIDCIPIRLKKENLGFCMNHIWHAARIEALKMWADGVVDFQDRSGLDGLPAHTFWTVCAYGQGGPGHGLQCSRLLLQ